MELNKYYKVVAEWLNHPKNYGIMDLETNCLYKFPAKFIIRIGAGYSEADMHLPCTNDRQLADMVLENAKQKASRIPDMNSEILIFQNMGTTNGPDTFTIRDLGMPKGATFLNDVPVDHNPVHLEDKDIIELGPLRYRLQFHETVK